MAYSNPHIVGQYNLLYIYIQQISRVKKPAPPHFFPTSFQQFSSLFSASNALKSGPLACSIQGTSASEMDKISLEKEQNLFGG